MSIPYNIGMDSEAKQAPDLEQLLARMVVQQERTNHWLQQIYMIVNGWTWIGILVLVSLLGYFAIYMVFGVGN